MAERKQCVVLAGGLGTRIRSIAGTLPKAMLPVAGRPFVHYQLDWLASEGVTGVVFCIGYGGSAIREYAGDGSRWGLDLVYVDEGSHLKGTGGALRLALDRGVLDPVFAVLYGDSFLQVSIRDMWARFTESRQPALMAVLRNEGRWDRSNAIYDHGHVLLYDKTGRRPEASSMRYIDYGISILTRAVVESLPVGGASDLSPVLNRLSTEGLLAGFEASERFYEIGSPEGLRDFEEYIAQSPHGRLTGK